MAGVKKSLRPAIVAGTLFLGGCAGAAHPVTELLQPNAGIPDATAAVDAEVEEPTLEKQYGATHPNAVAVETYAYCLEERADDALDTSNDLTIAPDCAVPELIAPAKCAPPEPILHLIPPTKTARGVTKVPAKGITLSFSLIMHNLPEGTRTKALSLVGLENALTASSFKLTKGATDRYEVAVKLTPVATLPQATKVGDIRVQLQIDEERFFSEEAYPGIFAVAKGRPGKAPSDPCQGSNPPRRCSEGI
jgi:hypothetical protein